MGDMLTLIEKAGETVDKADAERMSRKLVKGEFNLDDFLNQLQQIKKMGPLTQMLDMIPAWASMTAGTGARRDGQAVPADRGHHQLDDAAGAPQDPKAINGSRKRRIARAPAPQ
jgi:signal recognition particle subunit SRP54